MLPYELELDHGRLPFWVQPPIKGKTGYAVRPTFFFRTLCSDAIAYARTLPSEVSMTKSNVEKSEPTVAQVAEVMSRRISHPVGAGLLRSHGISVSRSWRETVTKVKGIKQDSDHAIKAAAAGQDLLRIRSLISDKRLTWYSTADLNADMHAKFEMFVAKAVAAPPVDKEWVAKYPYPLSPTDDAVLKAFDQNKPILVSVWAEERRTFFQFFNVRTYTEREELSPTGFSPDAYENIKQYAQIIGVKSSFVPCFDTVVVDGEEQRIELRIDIPSAAVPNEVQAIAMQRTLVRFNELSYAACGASVLGLQAFDFFPLLGPLYRDRTAGKVSMLGFGAYAGDSASNNTGKPIRKRGYDLRMDRFHAGGAGAVEDLRPYTIGIEWPALRCEKEVINLEIPGSITCLYKSKLLSVAHLLGCVTFDEYEFLLEQIKYYAQAATTEALTAASKAQAAIAVAQAAV